MEAIGGLEAVVIDCDDPEGPASFWAAIFGTTIVSREREPPYDVRVDDIDAATERLEALGGRRIDAEIGHEVGYAFRAVADLEGNEFCLVHQDGS